MATSETSNRPVIISGNIDVGQCCDCDLYDGDGKLVKHIPQQTLYLCQNPGCNHYVCEKHRQPCNYCEGCCAEEHQLGSHL